MGLGLSRCAIAAYAHMVWWEIAMDSSRVDSLLVLLLVLLKSGVGIRPVTGLMMIALLVATDLLVLT